VIRGVVAAGHPVTAGAAAEALAAGGNAFDGVVAAAWTACVAEPVLASLGGGGFLTARRADGQVVVYDFFVAAPRRADPRRRHPIRADFGGAAQEFHIGLGSVAVPGVVAGLFRIQRELGRLPMARLLAPARRAAEEGFVLNEFQGRLFQVVRAIYTATPEARSVFGRGDGTLVGAGDRLRQPALAGVLERLAREGPACFYRGALAEAIAALCRDSGVDRRDLAAYRVIRRAPLAYGFRGARVYSNPPPASGGLLVRLVLEILQSAPAAVEPEAAARRLAAALSCMEQAREDCLDPRGRLAPDCLGARRWLECWRARGGGPPPATRGTTHISVADGEGGLAALSLSNGEGCGHLVPGTGIMLNNMLGEADVHPGGFDRLDPGERPGSMMAPTLARTPDGAWLATGSGGSARIRSAVAQVLVHMIEGGLAPAEAVARPRLHVEGGRLQIEGGHPQAGALGACYPGARLWAGRNLYFGGAHSLRVHWGRGTCAGAGDPRRAGASRRVEA